MDDRISHILSYHCQILFLGYLDLRLDSFRGTCVENGQVLSGTQWRRLRSLCAAKGAASLGAGFHSVVLLHQRCFLPV